MSVNRVNGRIVGRRHKRGGAVLILAAAALFVAIGITALAVDLGYVMLARAQLQAAADSAALAGVIDLYDACGIGATIGWPEAEAAARAAAVQFAAAHSAGGLASVYADSNRDVRLGRREWDEDAGEWTDTWGVSPYNMIEVTLRRSVVGSDKGDQPLSLFFGPVVGEEYADVTVSATVCFSAASGIRVPPGGKADILPFVFDEPSWNEYLKEPDEDPDDFADEWSIDPDTGLPVPGPDGIPEIDFYPYSHVDEGDPLYGVSGNRGALRIGHHGASSMKTQIREGLTESDFNDILSQSGLEGDGELSPGDLPLTIGGEPGFMATMEDAIQDAILEGQPRSIAIFSAVTGHGSGATYTIPKFVGIRLVDVSLKKKPRRVVAQPTVLVNHWAVTPGTGPLEPDTILGPLTMIK